MTAWRPALAVFSSFGFTGLLLFKVKLIRWKDGA